MFHVASPDSDKASKQPPNSLQSAFICVSKINCHIILFKRFDNINATHSVVLNSHTTETDNSSLKTILAESELQQRLFLLSVHAHAYTLPLFTDRLPDIMHHQTYSQKCVSFLHQAYYIWGQRLEEGFLDSVVTVRWPPCLISSCSTDVNS